MRSEVGHERFNSSKAEHFMSKDKKMFVRCSDLFRFFLSPCVRKRTFWRKDRQFCQLSAVWTSFGGHVKLSSANGGRRKGEGRQSPPGIRTAFVRRACRNRAIGLLKQGVSGGRSGSWRNRFPTFCVFCPVFRRKSECFCRRWGVFLRYFPTALFFSSVVRVTVCLIDDYLFDRICDLFELTIRFA